MGAKENFINKKRLYTTEDDYRNKPTTMTNLLPFKKKLTWTDKPNDNGNKPITTTKLLPKAKKKNSDKPNDNRNRPSTMANQKTIDHT